MTLLIDTREQLPLWTEGLVKRVKLDVGDYTTSNLLGVAHAERKSANDLYGSILQGHQRFRKEILRAKESGTTLTIFVECPEKEFYLKSWDVTQSRKASPKTLQKIVQTISLKYDIGFVWCKGRKDMRSQILSWLKKQEGQNKISIPGE